MIFQLASDLHLEFYEDRGVKFLKTLKPAADTLVLAGDITSLTKDANLDLVFKSVSPRWKNIIYTIGNHEVYFRSIYEGWETVRRVQSKYTNIHCLNNEEIVLEDVKIFGGTGWFPETYYPDAKQFMSDFKLIKDVEPNAYLSNYTMKKMLQHSKPDVVITHHLPNDLCVHPRYKGSPLNDFFVAGLDVEKIGHKLHMFGHTHFSLDIQDKCTRLVSNPRGYPRDQDATWNPELTLEV